MNPERSPRHSILYNSCSLSDEMDDIGEFLQQGIKVLWFGTEDEAASLKGLYPSHAGCRLLFATVSNCDERLVIIDGGIGANEAVFHDLSSIRDFNAEQYLVEHSSASNIVVEASAGTGKTTVMIDRIMYLLDTDETLEPSQIAMITFTNDAADQMNQRLQDLLMRRYEATGNMRYMELLEKQSQMSISTIHSFAFKLIRHYAQRMGYTRDVAIESFKHDLDQAIGDELNIIASEESKVDAQIGLPLHESRKLIHTYWDRLLQLGVTNKELNNLDWGETRDGTSELLQKTMARVIPDMIPDYQARKRERNAVSLSDMIRDLDEFLSDGQPADDLDLRYLFVDEFQDSDDSQIDIVAMLCAYFGVSLFVVGDVKQSIYRFRGADDSAFDTLYGMLRGSGAEDIQVFSLVDNYRTSPAVLEHLEHCFMSWSREDLLKYGSRVRACRDISGLCEAKIVSKYDSKDDILADCMIEALSHARPGLDGDGSGRPHKVAVLVRTNSQCDKVSVICGRNGIPVVVRQDRCFYTSDAVRDFYAAFASFAYRDPVHLFNYMLTPYCSLEALPDIDDMILKDGDEAELSKLLHDLLAGTTWPEYESMLSARPAMNVVKEMIENERVAERYMARLKSEHVASGWIESSAEEAARAAARQYKCDLDKLMVTLQGFSRRGHVTPLSLCRYLELMMSTNRDEMCDSDAEVAENCINCMTVHKAKGLEFDTVIIPFTDWPFRTKSDTDILLDRDSGRMGWKYKLKDGRCLQNVNYGSMRVHENEMVRREETRLLYVALTRTVSHLVVLVGESYRKNTWGQLLTEGGFV